MPTFHIDLVSDVVCPWCPIGEARLREAMCRLGEDFHFEIEWRPFVLNGDLPSEGRDMLDHLSRKYGQSEPEVRASQANIVAAAEQHGLNFARATERRSWNTFHVHRVLAWAKEQGQDEAFNHALFEAYFGDAKNPTDPALLRSIAESLGLDPDAVDAILASDRYAADVRAELDHYRGLGVSSVPSFIVEGRYLISGAQDPDTLADAFRRMVAESAGAT